jgi:nitroreductase
MADPTGLVRPLVRVRQIRTFTEATPTDAQLEAILDAARWTGSSGNSQPWRFMLIREVATIRAIGEAGLSQTRPLLTAPVAIAVVLSADDHEVSRAYDEGRAVERIMIAAELVGLRSGITWIRRDVAPIVADALAIPEGWLVRTIMAIGYPTEAALAPKSEPGKARLPRSEVVMHERWRPGE